MTTVLIPLSSTGVVSNRAGSSVSDKELREGRQGFLRELRCVPGIVQAAKELKPGEVYKIVSFPDGGKLYKDAAGNFKGVFYKDGKILEHTKFQAVRPSLVKAATAVGSQILLISIAMQLNRIEKNISKIFTEFHNDRIAEINAGVNLYSQAINAASPEVRERMIAEAVSVLNTGIEKSLRSLKQQIADAPDDSIGFFDNWVSNKAEKSEDAFRLADESFHTCLLGIQTLADCYASIGEPLPAAHALRTYIGRIDSCDIASAARKARLVPSSTGKTHAEQPWNAYLEHRTCFDQKIAECEMLANDEFDRIEIEVKPEELLENENG